MAGGENKNSNGNSNGNGNGKNGNDNGGNGNGSPFICANELDMPIFMVYTDIMFFFHIPVVESTSFIDLRYHNLNLHRYDLLSYFLHQILR